MKNCRILARVTLGLIVAVLVTLASVEGALAHASPVRADPAPGARLAASPQRVTLWFSEPVEPKFSRIRVLDSAGKDVDNGDSARDGSDPTAMSVSVRPLSQGVYTVAWRNVSVVDGHPLQGSFTFSVGGTSAPGQTALARPPVLQSPPEPFLRWLGLLAALALVGGFSFSLLVAAPALRSNEKIARSMAGRTRTAQWIAAGALAAVELGRLLVQASAVQEIPLHQTLGAPALRVLVDTEWGRLLLWRMALLALTVLIMALPGPGRGPEKKNTGTWLGLGLGAGMLATFSLASHGSALAGLRLEGALSDYLHLLAASFWIGGLLHFLAGMPAFRSLRPKDRSAVLTAMVPRFSTIAVLSVVVLIITGLYSAWGMTGTLVAAYTGTAYGLSLIAKIALLLPLLVLAAINLLWVRPHLSRGQAGDWLRKLVFWEVILIILLLLPVGFLTTLEPARQVSAREGLGQQQAQFLHAAAGDKHISVRVEPGYVGPNRLTVDVSDLRGNPVNNADVNLRLVYTGSDLGTIEIPAAPKGNGQYSSSETPLGVAGSWRLELTVRNRGSFDARAVMPFRIAASATNESGATPVSAGKVLFGLELLLLGFFFQGSVLRLGAWRGWAGATLMALGGLAAGVGLAWISMAL